MAGEKESILLSVKEKRIGETQILRNEGEEELFSQMLLLHSQSRGQAKTGWR